MKLRLKATLLALVTSLSIGFYFYSPRIFAQDDLTDMLAILKAIQKNTYDILVSLNEMVAAWVMEDKTTRTANFQADMSAYIDASLVNEQRQISDLNNFFMKDYFSNSKTALPYVNQLNYPILLGKPYSQTPEKDESGKAVNSAYQYIKNASGLNITHYVPSKVWRGTAEDKTKYANYYKTISAVQSFNTFVLSALYADSQNGLKLTKTQESLLKQASDPNWFVDISSEPIGLVLRQILLFNSQNFVLLTKILETNKQQLAAQSITNTLMILGNQFTEENLYSKATGTAT